MPEELLTAPTPLAAGPRLSSFQDTLDAATPIAFVTPALVAINIIVFLVMTARGVPFLQPSAHQVLPWGANFGPLTASGQWWRLVTACFLHFGVMHIAVNLYVLWQVGVFTERLFGNLRFTVLYLLAGVGGNLAGLFFHPFAVGAGASGAIFGVYGGLLGFLLIERGVVPAKAASGIALSAGFFVLFNLVVGLVQSNTDQVAHIAGILVGFAAGCLLAQPLTPGRLSLGVGRAVTVAALFTAAGLVAVRHLPAHSAAETAWYRNIMTAPRVTVTNNNRVAYIGSATQADAERLAVVLQRVGVFPHSEAVVLLDRNAAGTIVSIPMNGSAPGDTAERAADRPSTSKPAGNQEQQASWNDPRVLFAYQKMGPQIASAAGGPPLTIRLLDSKGEPQREVAITSGEIAVGARDRVAYSGAATAAQASALGMALRADGFFADRGTLVVLGRESASAPPVLTIFMVEGGWDDPRAVGSLEDLARTVGPSTGGLPLVLHLLDAKGQLRKELLVQP